jgi:hypothetical protein
VLQLKAEGIPERDRGSPGCPVSLSLMCFASLEFIMLCRVLILISKMCEGVKKLQPPLNKKGVNDAWQFLVGARSSPVS